MSVLTNAISSSSTRAYLRPRAMMVLVSIDQTSITPPVESLISPTLRFFETMSGASMNARASNTGAAVLKSGEK